MIRKIKTDKENELQAEAFRFYYALGSSRNLSLVAEKFNRSIDCLKNWSGRFNWSERIQKQEAMEHSKARKELTEGLNEIKERSQRLVKKLLDNAEQDIKEGLIKITSAYDISLAIKSELLLAGEATEKEERKIIFETVKGRDDKEDEGNKDKNNRKVLKFPQQQ